MLPAVEQRPATNLPPQFLTIACPFSLFPSQTSAAMGKSQKGRVATLSRTLQRVTTSLNESFALLDSSAPSASETLQWSEVKKAADLVSKHATTIGLLWTQSFLKVDEAEDAMKTLANSLQGLILLCHGYTVGAGPTLQQTIRNAVKGVLGASLSLMTSAVSFSVKGSSKEEREGALPAIVGCVWEACGVMKKTPFTNRAAIGRSLAQVATSVKDVLREIGEMRDGGKEVEDDGCGCGHVHEAPSGSHSHGQSHNHGSHNHGHGGHNHSHSHGSHNHSHDGPCGHDHSHGHGHDHGHSHGSDHAHGACGHDHSHEHVHDHSSHEDCGHDHEDGASSSVESLEFNDELSPEEIVVADATKGVVNSVLAFLKELLYVAADPEQGNDESATLYLETILQQCKTLGVEVDEFGASLYPPQEINQLRDRGVKTDALVGGITEEVKAAKGLVPEGLEVASAGVKTALTELKQSLGGLS